MIADLLPASLQHRCANCDALLVAEQRFCGVCGQRAPSKRLTLHDLLHDLTHAFLHFDSSALALLRGLLVRPGRVAREYVDGHRKRYFGPFAFFVIIVGASALIISATDYLAQTADGSNNLIKAFLQRHVNILILLQVPILSGFCALMFRRDKLHFAEHSVLVAYASGFRSLIFSFVAIPIWYFTTPRVNSIYVTLPYLFVWFVYFGFAASQFYAGSRAWTWLKGTLAAILTQATTIGLVTVCVMIYMKYFPMSK